MKNIRTISRLADSGEDMRHWYSIAWRELQAHDSPILAANCLAITSPKVPLTRNVKLAKQVIAGIMPIGILPSVAKSIRHYWQTGQITGKKTSAFARCLTGCPDSLCLDTHMARGFNIPQKLLFRSDILARITRIVSKIASRNNWTIAETQAAIWSGTLRQYGRNPKYFPLQLLF